MSKFKAFFRFLGKINFKPIVRVFIKSVVEEIVTEYEKKRKK